MATENIIGLLILIQLQLLLIAWQIGYKREYHRGYTGRVGEKGEKGDMGPKGIDYKKEENWVVKRIGSSEGNQVEYLAIRSNGIKHGWEMDKAKATLLDKDKANSLVWDMSGIGGFTYWIETSATTK